MSARKIRAYWQKWRGISIQERQYRRLADDKADADTWLHAASQLAQPTNVSEIPSSSIDRYTVTTPLAPGQTPKLRGEAMRAKTSPSVTELFVRRLTAMPNPRYTAALLEAFADWDVVAAKPHLATFVHSSIAAWPTTSPDEQQYAGQWIANLTTARIAAGDPTALGDYAAWIATTVPTSANTEFGVVRWFEPMIAHPNAPEIERAATAMFGHSAWVPLVTPSMAYALTDLLASGLVHVPAFRAHVIAELANHDKLGTATMRRGALVTRIGGSEQTQGTDDNDPLVQRDGTTFDLRVADAYAAALPRDGVPAFRPYWPLAQRDAAIAKIVAWLQKQ